MQVVAPPTDIRLSDSAQDELCADIFNSIFATGPAVALIITLVLDNTVPGTREERGLHVWQQLDTNAGDWWEDDHMNRVRAALLCCSFSGVG